MNVEPQHLVRSQAICTSTWSDALDRLGVSGVCHGLTLRSGRGSIVGPAVTVREHVGALGTYERTDFAVGAALDAAYRGSVLMIDLAGAPVSTFGGLAARAAVHQGISGVVIDGGCRDIEEIRAAGLWVSSRHVTPASGRGRVRVENINMPITVCGTIVNPGDYIVCDETGIVSVPQERFLEVLEIAEELTRHDATFLAALDRGETFDAAAVRLQHT